MPVKRGATLPMSCGSRRHPVARRAGLWPATDPLSGLREDPLAARGRRRRDQYRPDCRLAGGASTGDDPDLALCGTGACTRPARGDSRRLNRVHTLLPNFFARFGWHISIFYYKNYFSHTQSREAYLEGALVFYEGLTNSIRPLTRQARDPATGPACVSNNSFQASSSAWLLVRRFFDTPHAAGLLNATPSA